MILDYKLFKPFNGLQKDTLWIIEQIPGLVLGADTTKELERSYWSSYNVPYFDQIYNISGYGTLDQKAGLTYRSTYDLCPRAKIFRRDHPKIQNINGIKSLLRFNDFNNDPFSEKEAWDSICSRGDLSENPVSRGCTDTKVTSYELFKEI